MVHYCLVWALKYASYMYHKKALELHPCFVFALYTTICFQFLSLFNYQFPTFAVVFYTYDATESHILKLCLKKINTHINMYFGIGCGI